MAGYDGGERLSSGLPFSDREKAFIRENAYRLSWGDIANRLGKMFPEDNGGSRQKSSVRSFVIRERARTETKKAEIPILVHVDIVTLATTLGYRKTDLPVILHDRLREMSSNRQ